MSRKDIHSSVDVVQSLVPGEYVSVRPGFGVDLKGYNGASATIVGGVVTGAAPVFSFRVQESDDDGTYGNVAAEDLQGSSKEPAIREDDQIVRIGYLGNRRFIRLALVAVGGTNASLIGAGLIMRGLPSLAPLHDIHAPGRF